MSGEEIMKSADARLQAIGMFLPGAELADDPEQGLLRRPILALWLRGERIQR